MDSYQSAYQITSVNLQDAQPPEQVQNHLKTPLNRVKTSNA